MEKNSGEGMGILVQRRMGWWGGSGQVHQWEGGGEGVWRSMGEKCVGGEGVRRSMGGKCVGGEGVWRSM